MRNYLPVVGTHINQPDDKGNMSQQCGSKGRGGGRGGEELEGAQDEKKKVGGENEWLGYWGDRQEERFLEGYCERLKY